MAMVVQHNLTAMNSNRMLGITTGQQSKSSEKLSSGYRINRAADDAAGLTISEKMRKQMRGLDRASTNAQDGVSAVQTAEGALTEVHSMLQRMNELAVQASNGTNSESDREAIKAEIDQLTTEIDRVAETTKFNEIYLLRGDSKGTETTKTIAAHDAGLEGKLKDNGDGTSVFELNKPLADGDKIKIAGKEYTIGTTDKTDADFIDKTTATTAATSVATTGDSVTHNGVTTTIVDKMTTADAVALTWAANDTFTDADGKAWKVVANTATPADGEVKIQDVATKLTEGSVITKNAAATIDASTGAAIDVVTELKETEVSSQDAAGITALQGSIKEGDVVTIGGVSQQVTDKAAKSFDAVKENIIGTAVNDTVKVGNTTYTVGEKTDKDAGTTSREDIIAAIKEFDEVTITMATAGNMTGNMTSGTEYTVYGVTQTAKEGTITADEAYKMIRDELEAASSIGTDEGKGASVVNKGNGKFEITQGTATVKDSLSFNLHVGSDADLTNKISVDIDAMSAAGLGVKGLSVFDDSGMAATYAIDAIADAIATVSAQRSALGAVQNRLEHTIANLDNVVENTTAAESRIRDTDMAEEMVEYSKNNILAQAGQSMLAQANQSTQGVLSLLQ